MIDDTANRENASQALDFPTWPHIPEEGIQAVSRVLSSNKINYWTGEQCRLFEQEFAQYSDTKYALAVANGTVAIEIALRAYGIGAGDEVIVPSRTFIATAGAVVAVGATPVVCDIDPQTNCMTALDVARVLTPRTKAVIPVHLGGYPAPIPEIVALASQVGAVVIEDCAQAHGTKLEGKPVGGLAHAGCFSFCQDKIIPLGEGGMITLNDREAYERAWAYRDHGRSWAKAHNATVGAASGQFQWLNDSFGTNGRLGEMEGALGRVLLGKLPEYHRQRTENAETLAHALEAIEGITPVALPVERKQAGDVHAYYRLYALLDIDSFVPGWTQQRVIDEIIAQGVPVQYGSCAIILNEVAFERFGSQAELPQAQFVHDRSIAFYVHPTLTVQHMSRVADAVKVVLEQAVSS